MNAKVTAAYAVGALLLTGCSGGGDSGESSSTAPATVTVTASSSTPPAGTTTTDAAASASSSSGVLKLGQTFESDRLSTTVQEVKPLDIDGEALDPLKSADERFVGFRVKTCTKVAGLLSWRAWSILGADYGDYPALDVSPTPTEFPRPAYPHAMDASETIAAGQCRTGWIVAPVSSSTQPERVTYQNAQGDNAEWAVK